MTSDTSTTETVAAEGLSRRSLLRTGGLTLGIGAFLSACAADFGGDTAAGRVGLAGRPTELPEGTLNDTAIIRTMQSLEHSIVALLSELKSSGNYSPAQTTYIDRFSADHVAAASTLGEHAIAAGSSSYDCENVWVRDRYLNPVISAISNSDNAARDTRLATHAFESILAHSYQHLVTHATTPSLRRALMELGAHASRRSALLAVQSSRETYGYLGASANADVPETDADGFPIPYAIPAPFGQVGQIQLIVGAPDADGARYSTALQTPAENTFVYDYMSC